MISPVRVLIVCCFIVVHVNGNESNIAGSVETTTKTDDVIRPQIRIIVRKYAKAEIVRNDAQQQDNELGESTHELPNNIKSQYNDDKLDDKTAKLTAPFDGSQDSVQLTEGGNTESSEKAIPNRDSFLSSFDRISDIASLAWDYVTQAEEHTQRPELGHDLSGSEVIKEVHGSLKTEVVDNAVEADDVYFEEDKPNKNEVSHVVEQENNGDYHNHESNTDNVNDDKLTRDNGKKLDVLVHKKSDKGNAENSKLKPSLHSSYSRNNVKDEKVRKNPNRAGRREQMKTSGINMSSWNSLPDETDSDINDNRKDGSNETMSVVTKDESGLFQADSPIFSLGSLFGFETTGAPTSTSKTPDLGPEDNEMDVDSGSASTVLGYGGDLPDIEQPKANNGRNFHLGIGYNGLKPVTEADLSTSDVSRLTNHYDTCDDCMVTIYNTSHRCHFYNDQADEFDKWAKYYTDLLRYGCSSQDVQRRERCCHKPLPITQTTLQEVNKLVKSIYNVLWKQCQKCPVDCTWSDWQAWDRCPLTCDRPGTINRTRTRKVEQYGGRPCQGAEIEQDRCPIEYGTWLSWSSWSSCSGTCGGTRQMSRQCSQPTTCSCFVPCDYKTDKYIEVENCNNTTPCCHFRIWSSWGEWTDCDIVDADTRTRRQRRWRSCEADPAYIDQPMCPQPCPGSETDVKDCCTPAAWSQWSSWSDCVGVETMVDLETGRQCGKGCSNRTRVCNPGTCPGPTCYGDHIERIFCNMEPCCVPPVWSQWCPWSECSVTSAAGIRRRSRVCQADPAKWRSPTCQAGGCYGQPDTSEVEDCAWNCVEPSWGSWGHWSDCDFYQTNPKRTMRRHCIKNLDPKCKYLECPGDHVREERCVCQRPYWETWSQWGQCNRNLVPPARQRHRACRLPHNPDYCPKEHCTGDSVESHPCCSQQEWGSWTEWSRCDYRSNPSVITRIRHCNRPDPGCPNELCQGRDRETSPCPTQPPCDPGYWGSWGSWSSCDCQNAKTKSRTRTKYSLTADHPMCPPFSDTQTESCDCSECDDSCNRRLDGKYPSCRRGCRHFITCCQGVPSIEECKGAQEYDSLCQQCTRTPSPTCLDGQYDIYKNKSEIPIKKPEECPK